MMNFAFPPFEYEAFLIPGVARRSVEIFVVAVSINPVVKSGSQVSLRFLLELFKHGLRINVGIITALKKRKPATIIRTQTTKRAY
jgi:phage terminase large subunit-like protein